MKKRACCLLLAITVLGAGAFPARAVDEVWPSWAPRPTETQEIAAPTPTPHSHSTDLETGEIEGTDGTASGSTEYIGHIVPSLVSVTVPLEVDFYIDPSAEVDITCADGAKAQVSRVLNAETAQVVNRSVVPVAVSVTATDAVSMTPGEDAQPYLDPTRDKPFTLVHTLEEVGPAGTALLVLGTGTADTPQTFASLAEFESRALVPPANGEEGPVIPVLSVMAGQSEPLWVYGKAASDRYYGHYQFSLTTTFHVEPVKYVMPLAETTGGKPEEDIAP